VAKLKVWGVGKGAARFKVGELYGKAEPFLTTGGKAEA